MLFVVPRFDDAVGQNSQIHNFANFKVKGKIPEGERSFRIRIQEQKILSLKKKKFEFAKITRETRI